LTLMTAPMSPHLAKELWETLGHSGGMMRASWPQFRAEFAAEEQVEIIIQLNGKVRGKIVAEVGLDEETLATMAIAEPKVSQLLDGKQIVKRIVIPDKLVNLVIR
jgi:leucyl-tRNA synthetase